MRLKICSIFLVSLICLKTNCANAEEIKDIDFNSDDTVVVEARNDDVEGTTVSEDETSTTPPARQTRQEGDSTYCVTSTGLSGTCTSMKECFPRLFPFASNKDNDTPGQTGVYNQNLALMLIESSGFCGESTSERSELASKFLGEKEVCCANSKVADFPLENDTSAIDGDYLKKACGKLQIDLTELPKVSKVVGGRPAVLGEFPWMVAMLRRGQQFCGGSLLDNRNVLTAAHCVEFMTKNDVAALRLHIGDLDIYSSKDTKHVERRAKRVLYHKGFTMKNLAHDIALIHLDKPVEFSKTIQPVCLHPGNPPYDTGKQDADVSGWGTTSSGGSQSSSLLTVRIDVITQDECNEKYAQASKKIGDGMVCAGGKGKDSCQGDSGGPLTIDSRGQAKQIGIVSWGIGCATYPGVYTRVSKYSNWLRKNRL